MTLKSNWSTRYSAYVHSMHLQVKDSGANPHLLEVKKHHYTYTVAQ